MLERIVLILSLLESATFASLLVLHVICIKCSSQAQPAAPQVASQAQQYAVPIHIVHVPSNVEQYGSLGITTPGAAPPIWVIHPS